jgi:hypothetical protein
VLPEDLHAAIPIPIRQHCIDNTPALDCFIDKMQSACLRTRDALQSHVRDWERIQETPCWWIYDYYPLGKGDESPEVCQVRKLIWDFKVNGQHGEKMEERILKNRESANLVVQALNRHLRTSFGEDLHKLTFVSTPASNQETHELRYKDFSELLCEETGIENAYEHIKVQKDEEPKHTGSKQRARMFVHPLHIRDRFVLIFDDIITKGNTLNDFKSILEHDGAHVICACSIDRTVKISRTQQTPVHKRDSSPEDFTKTSP